MEIWKIVGIALALIAIPGFATAFALRHYVGSFLEKVAREEEESQAEWEASRRAASGDAPSERDREAQHTPEQTESQP